MSVLCQHPYIVELKEYFEDRVAKKLYIVMRYCDGGDLSGKVQKRKGQLFPESQVLHYFVQICLGLKHIHDRKILYRCVVSFELEMIPYRFTQRAHFSSEFQ